MRFAALLCLIAPMTAVAVPVEITSFRYVTVPVLVGDDYALQLADPTESTSGFFNYDHGYISSEPYMYVDYYSPRIQTWASVTTTTTQTESDRELQLDYRVVGETYASVAETAPIGTYARAYAFDYRVYFEFEVLSPVVYTGPINVREDIRLGAVFSSGSVLDVGRYESVHNDGLTDLYTSVSSLPGDTNYSRQARSASLRFVAVPEPSTLLLLGAGLLGVAVARRRRSAV